MLNKHDCYEILFNMANEGLDVHDEISKVMTTENYIPKIVINYLKENNDPTVKFYLNLNNKAHKIIKEILTCDNKPVSTYIKIATSLITQATITLEHMDPKDIKSQNLLIKSLKLSDISQSLSTYFNSGDFTSLVEIIKETRKDVKLLLDN